MGTSAGLLRYLTSPLHLRFGATAPSLSDALRLVRAALLVVLGDVLGDFSHRDGAPIGPIDCCSWSSCCSWEAIRQRQHDCAQRAVWLGAEKLTRPLAASLGTARGRHAASCCLPSGEMRRQSARVSASASAASGDIGPRGAVRMRRKSCAMRSSACARSSGFGARQSIRKSMHSKEVPRGSIGISPVSVLIIGAWQQSRHGLPRSSCTAMIPTLQMSLATVAPS